MSFELIFSYQTHISQSIHFRSFLPSSGNPWSECNYRPCSRFSLGPCYPKGIFLFFFLPTHRTGQNGGLWLAENSRGTRGLPSGSWPEAESSAVAEKSIEAKIDHPPTLRRIREITRKSYRSKKANLIAEKNTSRL